MFEDVRSEDRIIHVCVNSDCAMRGSEAVRDRLLEVVEETGSDIEVNDYICFAACEQGPNLLIEHCRAFYSEVEPGHAESIVAHADGGGAVEAIDRSTSFLARKIFNMLDAGFKPGDLSLSD
ncbi:MAG: (2Fe-2S) ferredoxin domain-containing protein [Mycobacterium sp.]